MTKNSKDEYGIGKEIDEDYIDVETRRAELTTVEEEDDNLERDSRAEQNADMSHEPIDMSHRFDIESGSGAASNSDEIIDKNGLNANDGRSETRTFFYIKDVKQSDKKKYGRLYRLQEGVGDSQRDVHNRAADRRRYIDTFCGQLDMGTYQRERIKSVMESVNMSHMAHYSSQKVILAIITLVANEDGRFIRDEAMFRKLMDEVGSDLKEIRKIRSLLREKSETL